MYKRYINSIIIIIIIITWAVSQKRKMIQNCPT